jgi:hypothetical protein
MDMTNLMISLLFGSLGMGFFMYGKSMGRLVPIGAGMALMIVPYFIANVIALLVVCLALAAVPFFLREG